MRTCRLLIVPAASAAALVALSPLALGKGGGVAAPPAPAPVQLGTDLAVLLSPTTASPASQGSFSYTNLAGRVQLLAQVKGASFAGVPVSGPAEIDLTTRSLDCTTTTTTTAISGMTFSVRGEAKFQTASAPALTGLDRSRTTVAVVSTSGPSAGATVARFTPEPCVPGIL